MCVRTGEESETWYRSDRFFTVDGEWYFTTREGQDVGPFLTRGAAVNGLGVYIRLMQDPKNGGVYAQKIVTQGLWQRTLFH